MGAESSSNEKYNTTTKERGRKGTTTKEPQTFGGRELTADKQTKEPQTWGG